MIVLYTFAFLVCFVLLARIVDLYFISSLDKISKDLKLSSDAAGATLMAVGSSAPELFVALFAVLKPGDHQLIGIGSIVGSAIFNLLVIIGAVALVRNAKLTWQPAVRDILFYTLAVVLLVWFIWDGTFTFWEALVFLAVYIVYVYAVIKWRKILPYSDEDFNEHVHDSPNKNEGFIGLIDRFISVFLPSKERYYLTFFVSILLIAALSYVLVEVAVVTAEILNIPEAIIALTVLAAGTSIPDLFSSIIVAKQGRGDMAVSNAIGSNIFDILVGLGLPFVIAIAVYGIPISSGGDLKMSSIILFLSLIILVILLLVSRWKIGKPAGFILLGLYLFYIGREIYFM
jgi:K+-dependent Na+/Ca+ exchanger-like protein